MAQKARKDRAKANSAALNNLHLGSLILNILFIVSSLLFRQRSFLIYAILSIPAFICQFFLETTGRPKYVTTPGSSNKTLKSSGEDLAAEGLTEYMFDVVWVTWACLVAVAVFGNWAWLLWGVVPAYGAVKGYSLLGMAKGMMGGTQGAAEEQAMPAANRKQRRVA